MAKRTQQTHELKSWPQFFEAVNDGSKRAELRWMEDRDFRVKDWIRLKEWDPDKKVYTGREVLLRITHILKGQTGLRDGYGIISFIVER